MLARPDRREVAPYNAARPAFDARRGGLGHGTTQKRVTPATVMSQNDRDPWSFDTPWSRVKAREGSSGLKARQPTPPAPPPTEPAPPPPAVPSLTVADPSERSSERSTPSLISLLLVRPCSHNCSPALLFLTASQSPGAHVCWSPRDSTIWMSSSSSISQVATTSGLVVHLYTQRDELLPEVQRRTQVPARRCHDGPVLAPSVNTSARPLLCSHVRAERRCNWEETTQ
jgi:hypothetical protein